MFKRNTIYDLVFCTWPGSEQNKLPFNLINTNDHHHVKSHKDKISALFSKISPYVSFRSPTIVPQCREKYMIFPGERNILFFTKPTRLFYSRIGEGPSWYKSDYSCHLDLQAKKKANYKKIPEESRALILEKEPTFFSHRVS